MTKRNIISSKKGIVLWITVIFMTGLVTMVVVYLTMVSVQTKSTGYRTSEVKAFYVAEAGLHQAVWYLENTAPDLTTDGSWRTSAYPVDPGSNPNDPQQEYLGDATYTMWVENSGSNVLITSRGTFAKAVRFVQQEIMVTTGTSTIVDPVALTWREF